MERLILLLLLAGCSSISTDERLRLANECGTGPECEQLWDEWNEAEDRAENKRRFEEFSRCPEKYVMYGNNTDLRSCWRDQQRGRNHQCRCVSREAIMGIMR